MAHIYCPECGYKNQYSIKAPNFCGGCGERIEGSSESSSEKKSTPSTPKRVARATRGGRSSARRKISEEVFDEDETDINEVPNIDRLNVDVNMGGNRVIKGSDIGSINKEDIVR